MTDYCIITDSTSDLTPELVEYLGIDVLPMDFIMDEITYHHYPDSHELNERIFYQSLRDGKTSKTMQISMGMFIEYFEKYLKENKDVLYISFSSALSGTYSSACSAVKELEKVYKDNKVIVVDSKCASMGMGLLVYNAAEKKKDGLTIDELAEWVTEARDNLCHWFTVNDLFYLKRGGRVSQAAAVFGTMLNIKPVLHVDKEGRLIPVEKIRGRRQSLDSLVNHMEKTALNAKDQVIFISHGDCLEDAEYVKKQIQKSLSPKKIHMNYIGPIVGSHSGPGTVALFFIGSKK